MALMVAMTTAGASWNEVIIPKAYLKFFDDGVASSMKMVMKNAIYDLAANFEYLRQSRKENITKFLKLSSVKFQDVCELLGEADAPKNY